MTQVTLKTVVTETTRPAVRTMVGSPLLGAGRWARGGSGDSRTIKTIALKLIFNEKWEELNKPGICVCGHSLDSFSFRKGMFRVNQAAFWHVKLLVTGSM